MKTNLYLLFFISLVCLGSCDKEEDVLIADPQNVVEEKSDLTKNLTVELVKNFATMTSSNKDNRFISKSTDIPSGGIIIDECVKTTCMIDLNGTILTKSGDQTMPDSTTVDLYLVNFHSEDGTKGFSIATGDKRLNKVYAYTEKGSIGDTAKIYPLACAIKSIPSVVKADIEKYYQEPSLREARQVIGVISGPHVKTHWNQDYPYNSMCPYFASVESDRYLKGHAPVGCAAVATAQVVAYYQRFTSSVRDVHTGLPCKYDFFELTRNPKISYELDRDNPLVFEVSQLCYEIGVGCQIKWSDRKGNLDDPRKIATYLTSKQGYSIECDNDANVDINKLSRNIQRGNPHISAGTRKKPQSGHVWIWDGVQVNANSEVTLVHCNWGHGFTSGISDSDGWYTISRMEQPDPDMQPYFDDNVQIYITNY